MSPPSAARGARPPDAKPAASARVSGCAVFDHGNEIGRIEDVQLGAGEAPLLIVAGAGGKKYDVPFAEAYLEGVDLPRKQVRMTLPGGMLEINAPLTAEEKAHQKSRG